MIFLINIIIILAFQFRAFIIIYLFTSVFELLFLCVCFHTTFYLNGELISVEHLCISAEAMGEAAVK